MGYAIENPVNPYVMPTTQNQDVLQKIFYRYKAVKFGVLHWTMYDRKVIKKICGSKWNEVNEQRQC